MAPCPENDPGSSLRAARDDTLHVITGLVPVISIMWGAALVCIGMAGTGPAMTW